MLNLNDIKKDTEQRMIKSIDVLKESLAKMRTGRANPSLLEQIMVSYYGADTPLNQVANITIADARTLTVTPWEESIVTAVEKAIITAGLGLNPVTNGKTIRVPLPPLTEERRKEFVKLVRDEVEEARIAIRNIRRKANSDFKELFKEKEISEDEEHRGQDIIQKLTDHYIHKVDQLLKVKEADLMEI